MNRSDSIVIVGAGPAGLSAAYYLKEAGYRNVTVLERLGRVGGLCRSITQDYHSFDLGANYITPAFKEVRRIARRHGMKMYAERDGAAVELPEDGSPPVWKDLWTTARDGQSGWTLIKKSLRFFWERWKVRKIIDQPGFASIHERPDLCVSFHDWLKARGLDGLRVMFEMPITVMGYGYIRCPDESDPLREDKEIPAPHALKYMSAWTMVNLFIKLLPPFRWFWWPKRFRLGYQRLWETVAFRLNVLTNIRIERIQRGEDGVRVTFHRLQQMDNRIEHSEHRTVHFDHLIVACPLQADVIGELLAMTPEESELFGHVITYSYEMTSCHVRDFQLPKQVVAALPLTPVGTPWAITRQFPDSDLVQFYSRLEHNSVNYPERLREVKQKEMDEAGCGVKILEPETFCQGHARAVGDSVREFVRRVGGRIDESAWQTYDRWPYFQHYRVQELRAGYYRRLEDLQGADRTYYVGGLLNFELVDNIMVYARHLVREHFR